MQLQLLMSLPLRLFLLLMLVCAQHCLACAGKNLIRSGVSCQDKRNILDEHNRLRQLVALGQIRGQPPAKLMMEIIWDDELAAVAQRWASHCNENHDNARNVRRFAVGQNIARTWTTRRPIGSYDSEPDWRPQISAWFSEVQYYRSGYSSITGHYTQVVWGTTFLIGCGYSFYYDPLRGYTKNYVCNYGPSGNILGYKPYPFGWPECNSYGVNYSNRYSGLCSRGVYYPLGVYCTFG
ncbi:PREDICTED: venom allergen 5.01-like [Ceratosolen solmsi marchali]|uniref:Venom allergen 5.01-like n=1 Tax=Ceratosolen solmsi marchali TaxID=326594 RepID=A0AAJ6YHY8_9HYME|nr:PREDICTED: venom allergen 5.01-like [Ceratosolen solmsi marchali]